MDKIWDASFYCDLCNDTIVRAVYSDRRRELSSKEKEQFLEISKQWHHYEKHLTCWGCKKNIKLDQIESIIALPNGEAGDLCKECAEKYKERK